MGLTLHYTLRLPASTSGERATELLSQLHDVASTHSFDIVSELVVLSDVTAFSNPAAPALEFFATIGAEVLEYVEAGAGADPSTARGFFVQPGKGCETATFALMRRGVDGEWYWHCHCKTQYSSNEGEDHFVQVHCTLVAVLDAAVQLGFVIEVDDEGGYWQTRDPERLRSEVRRSNRLMAMLAGRLSEAHDVQAPIFEHPRFERLEMGEAD
jgi:hypothetical protein